MPWAWPLCVSCSSAGFYNHYACKDVWLCKVVPDFYSLRNTILLVMASTCLTYDGCQTVLCLKCEFLHPYDGVLMVNRGPGHSFSLSQSPYLVYSTVNQSCTYWLPKDVSIHWCSFWTMCVFATLGFLYTLFYHFVLRLFVFMLMYCQCFPNTITLEYISIQRCVGELWHYWIMWWHVSNLIIRLYVVMPKSFNYEHDIIIQILWWAKETR